ncbi:MAG TPA: pyrimidine reductase [Gammaproteobacteria bacterium]|nr:pyrimidine reductase [Gammaproteobacteria bacterium]
MSEDVLQLYPATGTRPLQGLYLGHDLQACRGRDGVFVYSNFITSLDGRIALPGPGRNSHQVPPAIANRRDWRLFQELAAQADLLLTSARFFRQSADAEHQAHLPIGPQADYDDLRAWRVARGLKPQPDIAVFSVSLDIPLPAINHYADRKVFILTGERADRQQVRRIHDGSHARILPCGDGPRADGRRLRAVLHEQGYHCVYAIAGPSVLHTLAAGSALDRLYLTTVHKLLGGTRFDTLSWGPVLEPPPALPLRELYLDSAAPPGAGQTLAVYGD